MGKKSRAAGNRFEGLVRKDLESKGWIVDKFTNNVKFEKNIKEFSVCKGHHPHTEIEIDGKKTGYHMEPGYTIEGKLVPCKPKFNPFTKSLMMNSGGFPDFIAFRTSNMPIHSDCSLGETNLWTKGYENLGVESKMDGKLDKEEKEKCRWLLENNIFSKILIAQKSEKRGEIIYKEFND